MKYLKMLGLAAVAALAIVACVGAGTASADELCTKTENPCADANRIISINATLAAGKSAVLEASGLTLDTCTTGTMAASISSQGRGINPNGAITSLGFGTEATPCSNTTDAIKNGKLTVESIGFTHSGTVLGTESEVTVFIKSLGVSCTYGTGTGTDLGTITGGTNTLFISASVSKTTGGTVCPLTATWTAEYTITNHNAVYVINN